jgi:hypothetical protein
MKDIIANMRNVNKRIPKPDMDLIQRLLNFVNVESLESVDQVYRIILEPRHPYTGEPFQVIEDIEPFRKDRAIISRMLRDVANRNEPGIANLHETLREKLGMTLNFTFSVEIDRGRIALPWTPVLNGVEAFLYYTLSLIFRHELDGLLRVCKARLEDNAPCDKVFLYTPKLRRFCSKAHKEIGDRQRLTDWWDDRREQQGLPKFEWGSRKRVKQKRAKPKRRKT